MSKLPVMDVETKTQAHQENGAAEVVEMKTYSYEEALEASVEYFNGDELAANVWINKYALKDSSGNIFEKSPDDLHRRLAKEIARVEKKYENPMSEDEIYSLLKDFKYSFGGGIRFKLKKNLPTLLRLDVGIGKEDNSGFYFGVNEAF